jgi:hypothetical protein
LTSYKTTRDSLYTNSVEQGDEVHMGILSGAKAEPTDPIRGFLNDIIDIVGFPRPEEALGTPADVVHYFGLPTVRDWLPMPADVGARVGSFVRRGMPSLPTPPSPMSIFPMPGEASREAREGAEQASAEFGAPMRQRYYQKPI